MKKVFLAILATIAVVGMVSCNKDDNGKGKKDNGKKTTEVNIKIDGNLDDWKDVPVAAEVDENTVENRAALLTLKTAADATNLYIYFEALIPEDMEAAPNDMFIDSDNDATTGFTSWIWKPSGYEFMIESEAGILNSTLDAVINMEDAAIYKALNYTGADGEQLEFWGTGATNEQVEITGFIESAGKVASGTAFVEMSILRSAFNARAKGKIGFGIVYNMVPPASWAQIGMLPVGTDVGQVEFLEISLP